MNELSRIRFFGIQSDNRKSKSGPADKNLEWEGEGPALAWRTGWRLYSSEFRWCPVIFPPLMGETEVREMGLGLQAIVGKLSAIQRLDPSRRFTNKVGDEDKIAVLH